MPTQSSARNLPSQLLVGGFKIALAILLAFSLAGLYSCAYTPSLVPSKNIAADLVLRNGDIYTVDAVRSWADAVAIKGEYIVYVGHDSGAQAFIDADTKVVDLNGKMILPGFQDVHIHPPWAGVKHQGCDLTDYYTLEETLAAIQKCVEDSPDKPFIRGDGWYVPLFPDGIPHKKILDEFDSTRPLYFLSADGHSLWVNSKALETMGVTKETPDPHGGRIERDSATNEPIGVFQEDAAINMAWRHAPYADEEIESGLRFATHYLNSLGITSIQDAIVKLDSNDPYGSLEAYRKLNESGDLTLRSVLALLWDVSQGPEQIQKFVEARRKYSGGNVKASSIKFWLDGIMEVKTAALLEPYLDGTNVSPYIAQPDLDIYIAKLDKLGFQVHIHAIGDATVRSSLDAFAHTRHANGIRDSRHHICHLELIHPTDIPRFKNLDVIANFQPLWAIMDDYITERTVPILGPERSRWLYPIGSVVKTGAVIAFGSDWYVSTADPLPQIETAVTREDAFDRFPGTFIPEERISLHDAIAAFTINAAYVNFQENTTGSIEVGKIADMVALDTNLFDIDPKKISDAKVLLTLFGGKTVYGSLDAF
ncbi:uncharacterized protein METZ01_LOCUS105003 [marine metagenome]|uniref:Amidohydrolase 3 domain-containing protein n=1 Tax=marine metagenome TaxID=408172 RepID=A0A381WI50_9ZZZZ